jgi:UDP-glucose 4-epimerase
VRRAERKREEVKDRERGTEYYEIASNEDLSVMAVAELVRDIAHEATGLKVAVSLVDNPRSGETIVNEFSVDTSSIWDDLGWSPSCTVGESVRELLEDD